MSHFELPRHIVVYRFQEAPADLRDLSRNGDDKDWLAVVPPDFGYVPWLEEGGPFGVCCVDEYLHPDQAFHPGYKVLIGSHA